MKQIAPMTASPRLPFPASRRLLLALGGVVALVASGCEAGDRGAANVARATVAQPSHREVIAQGGILLDVRTPGEGAGGHLDGALNIPVDALASRVGELPADKTIVVYCRSGRRSAIAADLLTAEGRKVIDIGTMGAW